MEVETLHFPCPGGLLRPPLHPQTTPRQIPKISLAPHSTPRCLRLLVAPRTPLPIPQKPPQNPKIVPLLPPEPDPADQFREKMLFLDSIGIDLFALAASHPPIVAASLPGLRSTVQFLLSMHFTSPDLRRIVGMCPEVLTTDPQSLTPVFTFLLREAGVSGRDLRHVINRRPRLLVSSVPGRLRPTLYFLQMLGITHPARHASLLSCSVEEKLIPRLEFLQKVGFSAKDARSMARRFPYIFCYSIRENLEPKLGFLVEGMRRELKELKDFPQFFSFSLEGRIKPRHQVCEEKGVVWPLPALLRPNDEEFQKRLEVCVSSTTPLKWSPLWHQGLNLNEC